MTTFWGRSHDAVEIQVDTEYGIQVMKLFATIMLCMLSPLFNTGGGRAAAQPSPPSGARIDSVVVAGVDATLSGGAAGVLLSKRGGVFNKGVVARDAETLETYLRERGWLVATVSAVFDTTTAPSTLRFHAVPGPRSYFGRIGIARSGTSTGVAAAPDAFPALRGMPFAREPFDGAVRSLIDGLAAEGFPRAAVRPVLTARADTVDVSLIVDRGERALIDSVAVKGLTVTKERVIRRETDTLIGKPVTPEIPALARAALGRLRFIRVLHDPEVVYDQAGRAVLVATVEETARNSFEGVMGYQPGSGGDSGELVGKVDLGLQNIFGTGRSSRVRWESLGGDAQDMEVRWEEPRALGLPFSIEASFLQERRTDLGYTRTVLGIGISRNMGRLTGKAGLTSETVTGDSLAGADALGIEAGLEWTALDNLANPRNGARYAAERSYSRKRYRYAATGDAALARSTIELEQYIPVFGTHTIALLAGYRRVDAGNHTVDPSDRWWIGGASTLRGYPERAFPAERALLAITEYRVLTGGMSRIFVFLDYGRIWNSELTNGARVMHGDDHIGYGFGFRIESAAGTLGFDYGLGKGDAPGEGKLHVRLTSAF